MYQFVPAFQLCRRQRRADLGQRPFHGRARCPDLQRRSSPSSSRHPMTATATAQTCAFEKRPLDVSDCDDRDRAHARYLPDFSCIRAHASLVQREDGRRLIFPCGNEIVCTQSAGVRETALKCDASVLATVFSGARHRALGSSGSFHNLYYYLCNKLKKTKNLRFLPPNFGFKHQILQPRFPCVSLQTCELVNLQWAGSCRAHACTLCARR